MSHARMYGESRYVDVIGDGTSRAQLRFRLAAQAVLSALHTWAGRCRQRGDLSELDDRMLRDIGVSREEAGKEARKPFWLD